MFLCPHSPFVVLYKIKGFKMDNFQMYTLYTLVLTTAKARMFSDQVVNTWSFSMTNTLLLLRYSINKNHLVQIFNIFDTDGNGIVDFREFMMATATAALILYLPSFKQMFISTGYLWIRTRKKQNLMDPSLIIFYHCQLLNDFHMLSRLE